MMDIDEVNHSEHGEHDPKVRQELDQADWKGEVLPRLLKYASARTQQFRLLGIVDLDPHDLVSEAITLVYSGSRKWNKELYIDLINFMISVIRSITNHRLKHYYQFKKDTFLLDDSHDKSKELVSLSPRDPGTLVTEKYNLMNLQNTIYNAIAGDDEAGMVLLCIESDNITPKEISEETGYEVKHVNNIIKRLRRKVLKLRLI
jgi:hypothetical protein